MDERRSWPVIRRTVLPAPQECHGGAKVNSSTLARWIYGTVKYVLPADFSTLGVSEKEVPRLQYRMTDLCVYTIAGGSCRESPAKMLDVHQAGTGHNVATSAMIRHVSALVLLTS